MKFINFDSYSRNEKVFIEKYVARHRAMTQCLAVGHDDDRKQLCRELKLQCYA